MIITNRDGLQKIFYAQTVKYVAEHYGELYTKYMDDEGYFELSTHLQKILADINPNFCVDENTLSDVWEYMRNNKMYD